jgi:hypothetical protein
MSDTPAKCLLFMRRLLSEVTSWLQATGSLIACVAGFAGFVVLVVNPKAGVLLLLLGLFGWYINNNR